MSDAACDGGGLRTIAMTAACITCGSMSYGRTPPVDAWGCRVAQTYCEKKEAWLVPTVGWRAAGPDGGAD